MSDQYLFKVPSGHPEKIIQESRLHLLRRRHAKAAFAAQEINSEDDLQQWSVQTTPLQNNRAQLIRVVANLREGNDEDATEMLQRIMENTAPGTEPALLATVPYEELHYIVGYLRSNQTHEITSARLHGTAAARFGEAVGQLPSTYRYKRGPSLTRSELKVLREWATTGAASDIAERLFISVNTVKFHLRNIYAKLGSSTREYALNRATALRLL